MMYFGQKTNKDVQWVDRGWYVVTEFEKTPSINFEKAVALAQNHPGFIQLMDERNVLIYRNIYREQDAIQFQELYRLIKNWKGVKLYFKGDEVEYDSISSGIQCYIHTVLTLEEPAAEENQPDSEALPADLTGFPKPVRSQPSCESFATETLDVLPGIRCIGCRRSGVRMDWNPEMSSDLPAWFFFGSLDQHRVFRLNHEELRQAVIGHLIEYAACPLLHLEQIEAFINQLPRQINLRKDNAWVYFDPSRSAPLTMRYYKHPAIVPVSVAAYLDYLQRVL